MKHITCRDLRESLTLLLPKKEPDGEGGWQETWHKDKRLWGCISPLSGSYDYHSTIGAEPSAAQPGHIRTTPPSRYRLILRATFPFPQRIGFIWHHYKDPKRLLGISAPTLIQNNRFIQILTMEDLYAPSIN